MPKPIERSVGIGPGNVAVKLGAKFIDQSTNRWSVGEELETWSGLRVRIIKRVNNPNVGGWRYTYIAEVIGGVRVLRSTGEPGYDPDCPACLRGRPHSDEAHEAKLALVRGASRA
jgi:hypothetical protein